MIARHVGKTEQELRERFRREPRLPMSSSFPDIITAEYAVLALLKAKKREIEAFMRGSKSKDEFRHTLRETIGITVLRGSPEVRHVNTVSVVLKKDPTAPQGYIILTGYPTP